MLSDEVTWLLKAIVNLYVSTQDSRLGIRQERFKSGCQFDFGDCFLTAICHRDLSPITLIKLLYDSHNSEDLRPVR